MTDFDALKIIAASLAEVKSRAALSHLPSHRIWVRRLHEAFASVIPELAGTSRQLVTLISAAEHRSQEVSNSAVLTEFCKLIPQMLNHELAMANKLLGNIDLVPMFKMGQGDPTRGFEHFSDLVTAVRQFVDNTVQNAFQILKLDAKEFNFFVLNSLDSFVRFAPDSLQIPFMSKELADMVSAFDQLSWRDKKNGPFCGTRYERFGAKVDYLVSRLSPVFNKKIDSSAKSIFRFSSEFTHVGPVSTLVTSSEMGGIYLGSDDDCFFPSTENFVELQFMLLKESIAIFGDFYLAALNHVCQRLLKEPTQLCAQIQDMSSKLIKAWRGTGWQKMFVFVSAARVRERREIPVKCLCGKEWRWKAPHWNWDMYCPACGTTFRAVPIWSDFGYVVLPMGPADVFGSFKPRIDDLQQEEREHLYAVWEEFRNSPEIKKFDGRSEMPLLFIRDVKGFVRTMPSHQRQQLYTFIAREALIEGQGIPIMCNCSYVTLLVPPIKVEAIDCWACCSNIKLMALERADKQREDDYIVGYTPDGQPKLFDVQGGYTKRICELAPDEHRILLEGLSPINPHGRVQSSDSSGPSSASGGARMPDLN